MTSRNKHHAFEVSGLSYEEKDLQASDSSSHPEGDSLLNQQELVHEARQQSTRGHHENIRILLAVIMSITFTAVTMMLFRPSSRIVWEDRDSGLPLMPIPERRYTLIRARS